MITKLLKIVFLVFLVLLSTANGALAKNIGIVMGTFDPIHAAHIAIADNSMKEIPLDVVYFIPHFIPPEKPNAESFDHRYNMVDLVVKRNRNYRILEKETIAGIYQSDPSRYFSEIIDEVIRQEGQENMFYEISGADAFEKFLQKGRSKKSPKRQNLFRVIFSREGSSIESNDLFNPELKVKTIFINIKPMDISSTKIKNIIRSGSIPKIEELPEYITWYIQRNTLYGCSAPKNKVPIKYYAKDEIFNASCSAHFEEFPIESLISKTHSFLPIDFDQFIKDKYPQEILEIILTGNVHVGIICSLHQDAIGFLHSMGFERGTVYYPRFNEKRGIRYHYILTAKNGEKYLFLTHCFGRNLNIHNVMKLINLLSRNLIPLSHLKVYCISNYDSLTLELFRKSIRELEIDSRTIVTFGYRQFFSFLLSDYLKYFELNGIKRICDINFSVLTEIDKKYKETHHLQDKYIGDGNFPYWVYYLPTTDGKPVKFICFRNLYGEQSEIAINELIERGARTFILFGSAGGLNGTKVGKIYAPTAISYDSEMLTLKNLAVLDYPNKPGINVASLLEETLDWLNGPARNYSFVEVENFGAAKAFKGKSKISIYSGLLITDLPGKATKIEQNEYSDEFINSKRKFFFNALNRMIPRIISKSEIENL